MVTLVSGAAGEPYFLSSALLLPLSAYPSELDQRAHSYSRYLFSFNSGVQEHPARQAQLTFAMARHALVDLAQVFSLDPVRDMPDRLPEKKFQVVHDQMCQSGVRLCRDAHS